MKSTLWNLFLLGSFTIYIGCGSSTSTPGKPVPQNETQQSDELYKVDESTIATTKKNKFQNDSEETQIAIGSTISVIESSQDGQWVHVGFEQEDDVSDLWISRESLNQMSLSLVEDVDPYDQEGYELDPRDQMEEFSLRKKMTYCYKYVKLYLLKHGMVKVYLPGGSAYMAANILPKHGFKKVSRKPSSAIVNDVCVYRGGPSGHGHIEIKTAQGWYYGYGYKASPIKNRTLIACFHK